MTAKAARSDFQLETWVNLKKKKSINPQENAILNVFSGDFESIESFESFESSEKVTPHSSTPGQQVLADAQP